MTRNLVKKNMRFYLGVPNESSFIIDYLVEKVEDTYRGRFLTARDVVYIVLQKIRTDDSFIRLGHQYGVSLVRISQLFSQYVSIIAELLKPLIYWPANSEIRKRLPVPFRIRYSDVISIIDAFEIQIQKPSDPIFQSLTWSSYKHCNTIKYLIAITPDGIVAFISIGYGGRTSDLVVTTECGYIDKLPPNKSVMADRGFKNVATVLKKSKCKLVRPPSVSEGQVLSKAEARLAKQIASLRIHVERAISRVREFLMLAPHACVHHSLVPLLDDCVTIACALVNLQGPLIK